MYDDFKIKKHTLISMVYTEKTQRCRVVLASFAAVSSWFYPGR